MSNFQRCLFIVPTSNLGCNQLTRTIFLLFTQPKTEFIVESAHAYDGMFQDVTYTDFIDGSLGIRHKKEKDK